MQQIILTEVINGFTVRVEGIHESKVYVFSDLESALKCVAENIK